MCEYIMCVKCVYENVFICVEFLCVKLQVFALLDDMVYKQVPFNNKFTCVHKSILGEEKFSICGCIRIEQMQIKT